LGREKWGGRSGWEKLGGEVGGGEVGGVGGGYMHDSSNLAAVTGFSLLHPGLANFLLI